MGSALKARRRHLCAGTSTLCGNDLTPESAGVMMAAVLANLVQIALLHLYQNSLGDTSLRN